MTARTLTLETRKAALSDAAAMSRLTLQLGYDCTEVAMRQRLARLRDLSEHGVFVAALEGQEIVGWLHVELRRALTSEPYAEIAAMVVSAHHRRLGIGRALAERAISWAESQKVADVRAPAQLHREDALSFYEGLGLELFEERQVYRRAQGEPDDFNAPPTLVE